MQPGSTIAVWSKRSVSPQRDPQQSEWIVALEVSGTGLQAKSEAATMQFVSVIVSARLPCKLLLLFYVFDWGLRSSLEKLILELSASDVDDPTSSRRGLPMPH